MTDNPETKTGPETQYRAEIKVMLKRAILDPQGRAVETTLHRLGTQNVTDVRIGKHIELTLSGERAEVEAQLERLIADILANPVTEEAHYTLEARAAETPVDGTVQHTVQNTVA